MPGKFFFRGVRTLRGQPSADVGRKVRPHQTPVREEPDTVVKSPTGIPGCAESMRKLMKERFPGLGPGFPVFRDTRKVFHVLVHFMVRKRGGGRLCLHMSVRLFADCCLSGADLASEPNRRLSVKRPNTVEENRPAPSFSSVILLQIQTILHKIKRQPITNPTLYQRNQSRNNRTKPESRRIRPAG